MISYTTFASEDNTVNNNQRHQIIQEYLDKLNSLDADGAIALFVSDGVVVSRHEGEINAVDFYPVFTQKFLTLDMKEILYFKSPKNKDQYAMEISSSGVKNTGEQVSSTFVVIFEFDHKVNKFKKIIIFANDTIKNTI